MGSWWVGEGLAVIAMDEVAYEREKRRILVRLGISAGGSDEDFTWSNKDSDVEVEFFMETWNPASGSSQNIAHCTCCYVQVKHSPGRPTAYQFHCSWTHCNPHVSILSKTAPPALILHAFPSRNQHCTRFTGQHSQRWLTSQHLSLQINSQCFRRAHISHACIQRSPRRDDWVTVTQPVWA